MGFFDKLFGKGKGGDAGVTTAAKRFSQGQSAEQGLAAGKSYLEAVAEAAKLDAAVVVVRPEKREVELRATVRGFPARVALQPKGDIETIELGCQGDLVYLALEHDPDAGREAAAFRRLPPAFQTRVLAEMQRLRVRWLRSHRDGHAISLHDQPNAVGEPVRWLADAVLLMAELAELRGAVPPGTIPVKKKYELDWTAVLALAHELARSTGADARVVERKTDEMIDVRWNDGGVPVRLVLSMGLSDLHASVHADAVEAGFDLYNVPNVIIDAEPETGDVWDDVEQKIFFGKSVYLEGSKSVAAAEAAVLRSLPPALLDELVRTMIEHPIGYVGLEDGMLDLDIADLSAVTDGGAKALAIAGLMVRVVRALPRGAAPKPGGLPATRCTSCNARWFLGPGQLACVHCGAAA